MNLSFKARGDKVAPSDSFDVIVVPGGFWVGQTADRVRRLSDAGTPVRVMVYDLFPLTNPEWFPARLCDEFEQGFDAVLPVCDRIVTLGSRPASDLAARYPEVSGRIRVAVPTLEAHAPHSSHQVVPEPGAYILALGTVEPRKNHRVILDAWRIARRDERLAGASLAILGRKGWHSDDIEDEIAGDAALLRIKRIEHATDAEVERWYAGCRATVHASWAEGFGLPVRESIARGIPTIVSSGVPLDGINDGFRLFEPDDPEGLAALLVEAICEGRGRRTVPLADATGWEPVLSALIDDGEVTSHGPLIAQGVPSP